MANTKNNHNKILIISIIFSLIIGISSCNKEINTNYIDNTIAIVYQNNVPYLINANKETYSLSDYDDIIDIFDDYIVVKKNNKYGYIKNTGEQIIEPSYDYCYPMKENKAVVLNGNTYNIIDSNNNVLYTFTDNYYSQSYFSDNNLVITDGDNYSYLYYDDSSSTFNRCNDTFNYAASYLNGYAVVGNKKLINVYKEDEEGNITEEIINSYYESDALKYNYYDSNHQLLFNEFTFDFADNFYDNWARVATYGSTEYYTNGKNVIKSTLDDILIYSYINTSGEYLHYNYTYEKSTSYVTYDRGRKTTIYEYYDVNETSQVAVPYACNFNDGVAVCAKYTFDTTTKSYIKNYIFIDTEGKMNYTSSIQRLTHYQFGYEDDPDYQTSSHSMFWFEKLIKIGNTYMLKTCNSLNVPAYDTLYISYNYEKVKEDKGDKFDYLCDVEWDYKITTEISEIDLTETVTVPTWMKEYNEKYLNYAKSYLIAKQACAKPYEMSEIFYNSKVDNPLSVIRITNSNLYGMVQYVANDEHILITDVEMPKDEYITKVTAEFLLDPIYDKIVY